MTEFISRNYGKEGYENEKLLKLLYEEICDLRTAEECSCYDDGDCDQCILDWLKQLVKEEQ